MTGDRAPRVLGRRKGCEGDGEGGEGGEDGEDGEEGEDGKGKKNISS
jgi:hypothetical protein